MGTEALILKGDDQLDACLRAFAAAPRAGALFCDIDGTVSPIAPRPVDAVVPDATREVLAGFRSRAGKQFRARLVLNPEGGIDFDFPTRASSQDKEPAAAE